MRQAIELLQKRSALEDDFDHTYFSATGRAAHSPSVEFLRRLPEHSTVTGLFSAIVEKLLSCSLWITHI